MTDETTNEAQEQYRERLRIRQARAHAAYERDKAATRRWENLERRRERHQARDPLERATRLWRWAFYLSIVAMVFLLIGLVSAWIGVLVRAGVLFR